MYRDEVNDDENYNDNANNRINSKKTITSKSVEYKAKTIGRTPADNNTIDAYVVATLKYLNNFRIFLDLPLIKCKIELGTKKCRI